MSAGIELPPRPMLPGAALSAVGSLAAASVLLDGAWRSYASGGEVGSARPLAAFAISLTMAAILWAASHAAQTAAEDVPRKVARGAALLLLGAAIASAACAVWTTSMRSASESLEGRAASGLLFRVDGDPSLTDRGASMTAEALDGEGRVLARVRLSAEDPYEGGSILRVLGRLGPLDDSDWGRSRFMRGEVAACDAVRVEVVEIEAGTPIMRLRRSILDVLDPASSPARALIAGVVCGRTTELNRTEASDAFSRTGLSHLVAVSGSHLALIAGLVQAVMERLGARRPARTSALAGIMSAYVVFTGGAPSAVRSLIMVLAVLASGLAGRRGHALSALSLTVLVLVAGNPGIAYDLGFQLSAASVLFIALFFNYLAYLGQRAGLPRGVSEALALTLAAQWATLPLTIPVFGQASLIAPAANLVAGPLMSALLVCGLVVEPIIALAPVLALLGAVPIGIANASIWVADLLASAPLASIGVDAPSWALLAPYALAAAVYARWGDPRRRAIVIAVTAALLAGVGCLVRWRYLMPPAVTVMDVGQADSILIRDGTAAVLVDAGVDEQAARALARQHVVHLDAVVITHWDRDHWGGLPDILDAVPVDRLIVAEGAAGNAPSEVRERWDGKIDEVGLGDVIGVGGFSCRTVWPREAVEGDENADSLCLVATYDRRGSSLAMLLTGDTEIDQETAYAPEVGDVDVLKIGHHGSKVSVDGELMDAIDPEVAIASAGEGNSYGHPSRACIEAVEASGARFLCTKDAGDVTVRPGEHGISLKTAR